ncbi:hypothetical protein [Luteithermobacter gelatinilyticus]|nr:hypothetical protein [Luteithermobacter gelatinilyticus]
MSKILESLPLTIIAGVVLTIIMVLATNYLDSGSTADVGSAVSNSMDKMK